MNEQEDMPTIAQLVVMSDQNWSQLYMRKPMNGWKKALNKKGVFRHADEGYTDYK